MVFDGGCAISSNCGDCSLAIDEVSRAMCSGGGGGLGGGGGALITIVGPGRGYLTRLRLLFRGGRVQGVGGRLRGNCPMLGRASICTSYGCVGLVSAISSSGGRVTSLITGSCGSAIRRGGVGFTISTGKEFLSKSGRALDSCISPGTTTNIVISISSHVRGVTRRTTGGVGGNTIIIVSPSASRVLTLCSTKGSKLGETLVRCSINSTFGVVITSYTRRCNVALSCAYAKGVAINSARFSYRGRGTRNRRGVGATLTGSYGYCFIGLTLALNTSGLLGATHSFKFKVGCSLVGGCSLLSNGLPGSGSLGSDNRLTLFNFKRNGLATSPLSFYTTLYTITGNNSFGRPRFVLNRVSDTNGCLPTRATPRERVVSENASGAILDCVHCIIRDNAKEATSYGGLSTNGASATRDNECRGNARVLGA